MLSPRSVSGALLWISTLAAVGRADHVDTLTSFGGHNLVGQIDRYGIKGWQVQAEGHAPDILSDRVVLTPQYPGNKRGAIWADHVSNYQEWTVDFEFRANGEEHGGGSLNLWYVKEGLNTVGTNNVYTVGKFDGLVIVVDTHGGFGGIRGFLNDGGTDYKHHFAVDSLAFGHCAHSYRNLGRTTHLKIKQTHSTFEVMVDGNVCFQTGKIGLPPGNFFGISASSTDTPDSFEVFQFTLSTPDSSSPIDTTHHDQQQQQQQLRHQPPPVVAGGSSNQQQQPPNTNTGEYQTGDHPDIKSLQGQMNGLSMHLGAIDTKLERILHEVQTQVHRVEEMVQKGPTKDDTGRIEHQLSRVELMLRTMQDSLKDRDYKQQLIRLEEAVHRSHGQLFGHFQETKHHILSSLPRMGFFVFLVLGCQAGMAGLYVFYKRRRSQMPKKYL